MTLSRDELARIQRLRERFLEDELGGLAIPDYWRDDRDLAAYDKTLAARIGWKWDAALAECKDRGLPRADDKTVLDYGCGSGIAARRFVAAFGAREVRCFDRSRPATAYASKQLKALPQAPFVVPLRDVDDERPDVLLVSHVLGELDDAGERPLRALIERSACVLLVEPGNRRVARKLSSLRDALLAQFTVVAPCPHQGPCPALASGDDWCHFFAPPPPEVFTDSDQVKTWKALGIDARALPYSFVCLVRKDLAPADAAVGNRLLGRADVRPHTLRAQVCRATGLADVELQKRDHGELWRTLKKRPESVRSLPLP